MNESAPASPPRRREPFAAMLARCGGTTDARGVSVLPGGRVYGSGLVLSPDGDVIAEEFSREYGRDPAESHWLQARGSLAAPRRLEGRTAVVAVHLGAGYAHWLLEELPRWLMLEAEDASQVIAHERAAFMREALELLEQSRAVVPVARHAYYACDTLVVPPRVEIDGTLVARLNAFVRTRALPAVARREKLYITREGAARRRVVNEHALWPALEARGFAKVRLEELGWREQAALMAGAEEVVAPHGAGLANLAFCRAGTRVVEFFDNTYVNPCFGRLARAAGLEYREVLARADEGSAYRPEAGRTDIVADTGRILRALGD